jgi:membrane-bound ClpP family serine protease
MSNQGLFFYGIKANLLSMLGIILIIISPFLLYYHFILTSIGFLSGIIILLKGKAMRFDYQMQSGSIIHRGDW